MQLFPVRERTVSPSHLPRPNVHRAAHPASDAGRLHGRDNVTLGELIRVGARFDPARDLWIFRDGSRGFFDRKQGEETRLFLSIPRQGE